jgi:hypothetical protein
VPWRPDTRIPLGGLRDRWRADLGARTDSARGVVAGSVRCAVATGQTVQASRRTVERTRVLVGESATLLAGGVLARVAGGDGRGGLAGGGSWLRGHGHGPALGAARALLAAVVEGQVAEVVALCDPQVVCRPVTRPGRSVYHEHDGMAQLVADVHAAWGRGFRVGVEDAGLGTQVGEDGSERVTVRLRLVRQTEDGEAAEPPVLSEFTVRGGLVTEIESRVED